MLEAFKLGGWGMFPTLICGVLTVAVSLRYAVKPERRFIPLLITTNVMTLVAGTLGFVTGLIATATYISQVETAQVPLITVVGAGESLHNIALALILMMFAAIAATIGAFRSSRDPIAA
jgi:hypothetical protein